MNNPNKVIQETLDYLKTTPIKHPQQIATKQHLIAHLTGLLIQMESAEPVAWISDAALNIIHSEDADEYSTHVCSKQFSEEKSIALYTQPTPLRELSDEQIGRWLVAEGFDPQDWDYQKMTEFARSIEAHLKGKT